MTRKKVQLAFITKSALRKASYKKRMNSLLRKVGILSTLCGIEACLISHSPDNTQPEVWPDVDGAQRLLTKFKMMPEMERTARMMNQESFIRQRLMKVAKQVKRLRENNHQKEKIVVINRCLTKPGVKNMGLEELNHNWMVLDQFVKEIEKKIDLMTE